MPGRKKNKTEKINRKTPFNNKFWKLSFLFLAGESLFCEGFHFFFIFFFIDIDI